MGTAPVHKAGAILHAGCARNPLPEWLEGEETRLDIDPRWEPDILASIAGLGDIGDIGPFDAVYCSHTLEHLAPHDVKVALSEFRRVLAKGGALFLIVPNLAEVLPTHDVLYTSPAGPITGHDLFYGLSSLVADMPHMAHRSGFIPETMRAALEDAGFSSVAVSALENYNLFGAAVK